MATEQQRQAFIDRIAPFAVKNYPMSYILPSLVIAQACLESAYGTSGLSRNYNNYFGIKGNGPAGTTKMETKEDRGNGQKYTITAGFRVYRSLWESVQDHGRFLSTARYKKVRACKDWKQATIEIKAAGYATDVNYPKLLQSLIEKYQLYKYDAQALPGDDDEMKEELIKLEQEVKDLNAALKLMSETMIKLQTAPDWAADVVDELLKRGIIQGDAKGKVIGGRDFFMMLVILKRLELLDKK